MRANYQIGDKVRLSGPGLENENYAKFCDSILIIEHIARSRDEHPEFDSAGGSPLYDFKGCPFSLYEWEIQPA